MTKQNFLAMSLPYGLKVLFNKKYQGTLFGQLCGKYNYAEIAFEFGNDRKDLDSCFPILHPLSDITKEIDGTPAFFRYYESDSPIKKQLVNLAYGIGDIDDVPFHVVIRMIKEHFDIAGLIENGEAIDINTIENPYK